MEIHLLSARGNFCTTGGQFCELPCDQTSGHTGYYGVSNERYGHYLSTDTPQFSVGFVVCILEPSKVKHFFKKLKMLKIDQLCSAEKLNFSNTFFLMAAILREIKILT